MNNEAPDYRIDGNLSGGSADSARLPNNKDSRRGWSILVADWRQRKYLACDAGNGRWSCRPTSEIFIHSNRDY